MNRCSDERRRITTDRTLYTGLILLLNKIQQGGLNSIKVLKILQENGKISTDCILMVDETYLEKATQYPSGEYVGVDYEGNLYKGIAAFMIVGLKEMIPFIVQAITEVKFSGEWLVEKISNCTDDLTSAEFCIQGIVTDNHASNVHAFFSLTAIFNCDSHQCINHPRDFDKKTYLFYDTVHIMKNIRNSLLNGKKFVFPEFIYNNGLNIDINFPAGFIQWKDLYDIYDKDKRLSANLNKAPKLSYQVLHPGNNKQSVPLALAIVHETTIAAARSYFPTQSDLSEFSNLINIWWTISNSK